MSYRAPLSGADAYLLALEEMMARAGQGQHIGLTVVRLGPGFSLERFTAAVQAVALVSSAAAARVHRRLGGVPEWLCRDGERPTFPVALHPPDTCAEALCQRLLNGREPVTVGFDFVPDSSGEGILIMRWRHALLDGKGAELLLAEIARVAAGGSPRIEPDLKINPGRKPVSFRQRLRLARVFKDHFNELSRLSISSLAGPMPRDGAARFRVLTFSPDETRRIAGRAHECTRGLFMLPWFLAVASRAHHAIYLLRGSLPESIQVSCAVQERKRGAAYPIWQNRVSQLFFRLRTAEMKDVQRATSSLQEQFEQLTRQRMHEAFSIVSNLLRRLPCRWYLGFLRRASGGHLTSFYYSYTGAFLPECSELAGASIKNGWHVPSVPGPPGTGVFFSERAGSLSAVLSWRDYALEPNEVETLVKTLRQELLGA